MKPTVRYLCRRGEMYQLRLPVPTDLQPRIGRKELRWSLATKEKAKAEYRTWKAAVSFGDICSMLRRMPQVSDDQVREIIRQFFDDLKASYRPQGPDLAEDLDFYEREQETLADEGRKRLKEQLDSKIYDQSIELRAKQLLSGRKMAAGDLSEAQVDLLKHGIVRALLEFDRYAQSRWRDPLTPHQNEDEFFNKVSAERYQPVGNAEKTDPQNSAGTKISKLISEFIEQGIDSGLQNDGQGWRKASIKLYKRVLPWFGQLMGEEAFIESVSMSHVNDMRDRLLKRPRGVPSATDFRTIEPAAKEDRVSPTTARNEYGAVTAFLSWCLDRGYIEKSPIPNQGIKKAPVLKSEGRRPFTPDELNHLFSSPMYSGCKSKTRRHEPGYKIFKDDQYWVLLLALYTGARLSDLAALRIEDVDFEGLIPSLEFKMRDGELKEASSERIIPIHSHLIDFGFRDFVSAGHPSAESERLFRGMQTEQPLAQQMSKVLNRYRRRIGLTDERATLHSFRHGMKDALLQAGCPDDLRRHMLGHSQKDSHGGYGSHNYLSTMKTWLEKADLRLLPPTLDILKKQSFS